MQTSFQIDIGVTSAILRKCQNLAAAHAPRVFPEPYMVLVGGHSDLPLRSGQRGGFVHQTGHVGIEPLKSSFFGNTRAQRRRRGVAAHHAQLLPPTTSISQLLLITRHRRGALCLLKQQRSCSFFNKISSQFPNSEEAPKLCQIWI